MEKYFPLNTIEKAKRLLHMGKVSISFTKGDPETYFIVSGIIKEDRLGLDIIFLQAKRWEAVVGRPEIQKFAGALQGQRARKGIFITTSSFTREAKDYVRNIDTKIILIDGPTLADYMIEHNVGVSLVATYELKRIDSDYFSEG